MTTLYLRTILVSALLMTSSQVALACGYLNGGFALQHPRSLEVTFALRDAANAGLLDPNAIVSRCRDPFGSRRALQRLQRFGNALALAGGKNEPSFSLLLVEDGLWSRYRAKPEGVVFEMHTDGAQAGETVVITGEAVLAAMEAGMFSSDMAREHGLILVIPGTSADEAQVLSAFAFFAEADNSDQVAFGRPKGLLSSPE